MNFSQTLSNTASGMVGNIEKAIIEIIDSRKKTTTRQEAVSAGGGSMTKVGDSPVNSKLVEKTFSKLQNSGQMVGKPIHAGDTRKYFYVQFNPSQISFSGYGGGKMAKTNYTRDDKTSEGINYEEVKVRITMDVTLIFDKVNVKDAFMADRLNTSSTAVVTGITQLALTAASKTDYSVQKEVEGFIAALRSPDTRKINFYWGDMYYGGILHRISSRYTMFNVQGEPVRGEVRLSITCADEEISEISMGRWQGEYQKAFQNQNHSYVKNAQKVGNLLNFNI
ncbi:MAG: hypothetical protein IKL51_07530 [Lachnospiraceae bacterium]|nr:hypothetical protein [Lachnospiraceae bacterium]